MRERRLWDEAEEGLPQLPVSRIGKAQPELTEQQHCERVLAIRELIRAGTIYQANLTLRFRARCSGRDGALGTFLDLRTANPAPHGAFHELPGLTLVSASPECFLDLGTSAHVLSRPIKGTAPRSGCVEEDQRLRAELLRSTKDRAELSMIVDLVRNDIGRVCIPGSVSRDATLTAEPHPTVWHLVGQANGRLAPGRDVFDLLRASFPPVSCIGAPMVRAMHELESLEQSRRGPYTGAFGWIGFDGSASLAVTIRTLCFYDDHVSYGVGGGIVYDSEPTLEWQEALLKGHALERVLSKTPVPSTPPGTTEPLTSRPFEG